MLRLSLRSLSLPTSNVRAARVNILQEMERPLLTICLEATRGNQIKAAELLGLNRNTLRKKLRELDIRARRPGTAE